MSGRHDTAWVVSTALSFCALRGSRSDDIANRIRGRDPATKFLESYPLPPLPWHPGRQKERRPEPLSWVSWGSLGH